VAGFLRSIRRASARSTKKRLSKYYSHFQGLVNQYPEFRSQNSEARIQPAGMSEA
jgi:hypothetical protein